MRKCGHKIPMKCFTMYRLYIDISEGLFHLCWPHSLSLKGMNCLNFWKVKIQTYISEKHSKDT